MKLQPQQILSAGFLGIILIGSIILTLPVCSASGVPTNFIDALFTSASAVCVTGLAVVNTATYWSLFGKIVIFLLIQIGGLGYMTLATLFIIIIGKQMSLTSRMAFSEQIQVFAAQELKRFILYIVRITLIIEFIGFVLLSFEWVPDFGWIKGLWYSGFHSVSAFCNAGFSIFENNLADYQGSWLVNLTISMLIVLGGIGYIVLSDLYSYIRTKHIFLHTKVVLVATFILIFASVLLIFAFEYDNSMTLGSMSLKERLLAALFQSVSVRTAGFNTINISYMTYPALFMMLVLMFVGASPSGTGGGIKTTTAATVISTMAAFFNWRADVNIFKKKIPEETVRKSLILTLLACFFIFFITLLLLILEQSEFFETLFEVVSAFATCGLSIARETSLSFSSLFSGSGKLLIILTMFIGRLGPITIASAMLTDKGSANFRYAEDKIMIG
ncbi:MAG: Ktr system potassium uptake protein B [Elusimicrobia bacterium ADurb.Bin231]|nr:MAG: Ktr system potassium uptake protein B [Elusimicrobia bacterium ADurb.Bin231]